VKSGNCYSAPYVQLIGMN